MAGKLNLKRAYEPAEPGDGQRVLVDRIWPRGLSKAKAHIDLWLKDVAPSTALRKWFGHEPERWDGFRERYLAELKANPAVQELRQVVAKGSTTLVYGAKDERRNQAVVLAEYLQS
jgi:uncharacterized protein YeaO (DUF488 family)